MKRIKLSICSETNARRRAEVEASLERSIDRAVAEDGAVDERETARQRSIRLMAEFAVAENVRMGVYDSKGS